MLRIFLSPPFWGFDKPFEEWWEHFPSCPCPCQFSQMVPTQPLSSARFQLDPTQLFCIRLKSNNGSPTILHHINMSLSSCPVHSLAFRLSVGNAIMVGTWILHHRTYCHCTYVLPLYVCTYCHSTYVLPLFVRTYVLLLGNNHLNPPPSYWAWFRSRLTLLRSSRVSGKTML